MVREAVPGCSVSEKLIVDVGLRIVLAVAGDDRAEDVGAGGEGVHARHRRALACGDGLARWSAGRGDVEWMATSALRSATPRPFLWAARSAGDHGSVVGWMIPSDEPPVMRSRRAVCHCWRRPGLFTIVRAEAAVPGSEASLLAVAATRGMAGLREEARRVVLGSIDRDELHRRQVVQARMVSRHWVDRLVRAMVAGQFRVVPPEVGPPPPFVNRLVARRRTCWCTGDVSAEGGSNPPPLVRHVARPDRCCALAKMGREGEPWRSGRTSGVRIRSASTVIACGPDQWPHPFGDLREVSAT